MYIYHSLSVLMSLYWCNLFALLAWLPTQNSFNQGRKLCGLNEGYWGGGIVIVGHLAGGWFLVSLMSQNIYEAKISSLHAVMNKLVPVYRNCM